MSLQDKDETVAAAAAVVTLVDVAHVQVAVANGHSEFCFVEIDLVAADFGVQGGNAESGSGAAKAAADKAAAGAAATFPAAAASFAPALFLEAAPEALEKRVNTAARPVETSVNRLWK